MPLFLLDRDGVVTVNRPTNTKTPSELRLLPRVAQAIERLNRAGFQVVICTNQPEVERGVLTKEQLDAVHEALRAMLAEEGARLDLILACGSDRKCPSRKPSAGMLTAAIEHFGAAASSTPFVGDQLSDLKAAYHAGCPRVLVRTGLGAKTLRKPIPEYLHPFEVHDDLAAAVDAWIEQNQPSRRRSLQNGWKAEPQGEQQQRHAAAEQGSG